MKSLMVLLDYCCAILCLSQFSHPHLVQHTDLSPLFCSGFVLRSGRHVVIIATRTILGKSYARSTKTQGIRPRSRTLTAVQDAMLEVISVFCSPAPNHWHFPPRR